MTDIIVIGGGPAGMFAAITAAESGAEVLLIEKNEVLGRKLRITGKGRCNVTNHCDRQTLLDHVARNPKFLCSAFSAFDSFDTMTFFESNGVPLKTERGNRVFPVSDRAADIAGALISRLHACGVRRKHAAVQAVRYGDPIRVETAEETFLCRKCILATGGLSYPLTGSTGDGYHFAAEMGHTIVKPTASLVGLRCAGGDCAQLSGLSLKNVSLRISDGKKVLYEDFGEMLFTHTGISGPIVLSASVHLQKNDTTALIDLKPALSAEQLDRRILRDFSEHTNKDIINALDALLPQSMIPVVLKRAGLDPHLKVHQVSRTQRLALANNIKAFALEIIGKEAIDGAVITAGGVSTKEIAPGSMQSKLCPNIYFAGEMIDVDAYTGGFNLQIAFSTGYLAGRSAAGGLHEND